MARRPYTEEKRRKASIKVRRWWNEHPEQRAKFSERMAALSKSRVGIKQSPEHIAKRTEAAMKTKEARGFMRPSGLKYKPWSDETRARFTDKARQRTAHKRKERMIKCIWCGKRKIKTNIVTVRKYARQFCSHDHYVLFLKAAAVSPETKRMRKSLACQKWRMQVFRRDHQRCRSCGIDRRKAKLHAHHILTWANFPQFRFDLWNGKTLCSTCHYRVHRTIRINPVRAGE